MNIALPRSRFFPRFSHRWLWLVASSALFFSGCLTTTEVTNIVRDSNYAMLLAADPTLETGGLAANPEAGQNQPGDEASARIEAFLAQHQDDPAMASALRLRQALLHVRHRSFALARAAFAQVKPADLHSPRDKALYAVREELLWWNEYSLARPAAFYSAQKDAAEKAMRVLAGQNLSQDLATSPALRDYFLEMRAWIGVKLALATADADASRQMLQDAVDLYADSFSPAELELLASSDFKNVPPYDHSTRRVLRARTLLESIAKATRGQPNARLSFSQPKFQEFYTSLTP